MAAPTTAMESVEYRQGASAAADRRVSVIRRVFGEATYDVGHTDKSISTAFLADGGYDGRVQTNPSVSEEGKGMSTTSASSSGSGLFVSTSFSGGSGDQQTRPTPGGGEGTLEVIDSRTGKQYEIKISGEGSIPSAALKRITAGGDGRGIVLYDPGYTNTAPVKSKISYIDGDKGILRYRGIPIEELAENSNYLESAYLLLYGDLPSVEQFRSFADAVARHSTVSSPVLDAIASLPHDAHPMGCVMTGIVALSSCLPDANPAISGSKIYDTPESQDLQIVRLIGAMPAIAAAAYLRRNGKRVPMPAPAGLGYAETFLWMIDSGGNYLYRPHPGLVRALDVLFLLHAEHEMNCSTAAVRHLASSGVDVYTSTSGAVGALYGPLHGGANEAVLRMLARIGSLENISPFLEGVKTKKEKLFGFGHRVYKNYDPRAKEIKTLAEEVFAIVGQDPLINVAKALEEEALKDDYFVERKLFPNVDFYSGLIYRAMGFPPDFFTVLFSIPRIAGYLSHWREQLSDPDRKIIRPQQLYMGEWLRSYSAPQARPITSPLHEPHAYVPPTNEERRVMSGDN